MIEHVYLIGCNESSLVKIGRSIDLHGRLAEIQRMSPVPLSILWSTPGGWELESRLHQVFRSRRSHGEWFDFNGDDPVHAVRRAVATGRDEARPVIIPTEALFQGGDMVRIVARDWPGPKTGRIRSVVPGPQGDHDYYVGDPCDHYLPAYRFGASELRSIPALNSEHARMRASEIAQPTRENATPPLYKRTFTRPHHPLRQRGDI